MALADFDWTNGLRAALLTTPEGAVIVMELGDMVLAGRRVDSRESPTELFALYPAKTAPPTLPRLHLSRPRLQQCLRDAADRRVTLVCAGAGCGKSTLLAEFVGDEAATAVPNSPGATNCCWYTVDDLDDDPIALYAGLAIALGTPPNQPLNRRAYLARIIAALQGGSKILVLDDIHQLRNPDIGQAVADLLRYLPPGVRVILAGRDVPLGLQPIIDWLASQGQVATVGWTELQLDAGETARAITLFGQEAASGWVLAWAHPEGLDLQSYLRTQVLEPLGVSLVSRLMRLAVLPSFDLRLAARALNCSEGEVKRVLNRVYTSTPLLERPTNDSYRFSETARMTLRDEMDEGARRDALLAAGIALGPVDQARSADCLLAGGDSGGALRALEALPLDRWLVTAPTLEHHVLAQLTLDDILPRPRLAVARAWSYYSRANEPGSALDILGRTAIDGADLELAIWHAYISARVSLAVGRKEATLAAYQRLVRLVAEWTDLGERPSQTAQFLGRQAILEGCMGDLTASATTVTRALAFAQVSDPPAVCCQLYHTRGVTAYNAGHYQSADEDLGKALQLAVELSDIAERAVLTWAQAGVARCRGEPDRALHILELALREPLLAQHEQGVLGVEAGHALADLEDFAGALKRYRTAATILRPGDRDGMHGRALLGLVICHFALGQRPALEAALSLLSSDVSQAASYNLALAEGLAALDHQNYLFAAGRFAAAAGQTGTPAGLQDRWQARLLEAQARSRAGSDRGALAALEQGLALDPDQELPCVGRWVVRPVTALLGRLSSGPRGINVILRVDGQRDQKTEPTAHDAVVIARLGSPPQTAAIRLFGRPALIVDGHVRPFPPGFRHKSIELFWYAASHPRGFSREEAGADVFPDVRDSGRRLIVALSELRSFLSRELGIDGEAIIAATSTNGLQIATRAMPGGIILDTTELSALSEALRRHREAALPLSVPTYFSGVYLAGLDTEWIDPIRRYWTTLYLRTLGSLADLFARSGRLQDAVRCHELALEIDPTLEANHAELIALYEAAGDAPAADAQKRFYALTAEQELGLGRDSDTPVRRRIARSNPPPRSPSHAGPTKRRSPSRS